MGLSCAVLSALTLASPCSAQSRPPRGEMSFSEAIRVLLGEDEEDNFKNVLPEGTVLWVEAPQPVRLQSLSRGQTVSLNVLSVNPRSQVSSVAVRSNAAPGLPSGCKINLQVIDVRESRQKGKTTRSAVVVANKLILNTGQEVPMLGALSANDDGTLPGWLEKRRYALKDKASSAESLAVVLPWAAELGPIVIGAAVLGTKAYQNRKMKRQDARMSELMAISTIDADLLPQKNSNGRLETPKFFVISTREIRY